MNVGNTAILAPPDGEDEKENKNYDYNYRELYLTTVLI